MWLKTTQYQHLRNNLRFFIDANRAKKQEAIDEMFQMFGTRDRMIAGMIVQNALSNFELKWKLKCLKLWNELSQYFDEPSAEAIQKMAEQVRPQDQEIIATADSPAEIVDWNNDEWPQTIPVSKEGYWRTTKDREEDTNDQANTDDSGVSSSV